MPDKYRILIQPRALADIIELCTFIERSSPQNAAIVAARLLESIDSLEILPHRYKVHRSHRQPDLIIRSMPVPPFIVYYRIRERLMAIDVLGVRHGSQMPPTRI